MESSGPLATAQFPAETPSIPFALPPPVASNTITTTTTTTTATFEEKKDPRFSFEFGEPEKEQPIVTENASNEPTNEPSLENAPAVTAQDDLPDGLAQLAVDTALKMESSLDPPVDLSYSNMDDLESYAAEAAAPVPQDAPMQAYAKLEFPDGQFYVHTLAVELGRDKQAERQRMRQARLQRRARKEQARRVQEQENVEAEAESESGQSRKKETQAMSNISESGGIVGVNVYPDSDESSRPSRRRKRKPYLSNDSSQSQSIAPANLHTLGNDPPFTENLFDDPFADKDSFSAEGGCVFVPIHPANGQSLKEISKVHVRIEYNANRGFWELHVKGRNGAFHDLHHYPKGSVCRLHHGSVIQVKGLDIVFKLPDNARDDEQAEDEGDEGEEELYGSESPLSEAQSPQSTPDPGRRSIPIEDFSDASSADDVPLRIKHKHKRPKSPKREKKQHVIKLKLKRPGDPVKLAQKKEKAAKAGKQPSKSGKEKSEKPGKPERGEKAEKADKQEALERVEKVEKAEKPKSKPKPAGTPDAAPKTEEAKRAAEQNEIQVESKATESATPATSAPPPTAAVASAPAPTPPNIPAELPAGSILAGLAPEEIPQKRKGPGRPPKNGVMSKRDEAIIKRKKKELQKLGLEIPPLGELLAMARAEGATKKDPKPDDGKDEDKDTPKPSIEIDPTLMNQNIDATPTAQAKSEASAQLDKSPGEKADAKPKRVAKSPSPQKPESEYTEEELRKPAQTYVVLIHEALSKSPTGIMDLQQIYDAMQKMYPFYKYRCQTHGWQSSVRHNLISSDAFEEAGKIGKGRLWKINPNVSIDKEKKRKAPTPPPERPTYQYPYTNGGQYPYGAPSNAPPAYGQPYRHNPYGNPYGPPTVNGVRPPGAPVPPRPGAYYSPYASNPQGPNQDSVYGPPSRPPYGAPGHFGPQLPPPPNGANPAAPNQSGSLNAPHPPATSPPQPHPQQADEQLSRQPSGTPQPQQTGLGSERTIEAIMDYHKVYISKFPNEEQEKARNLFRKAVGRHIDKSKDHGPFSSKEEEHVWKTVTDIIRSSASQSSPSAAPSAPSQSHPPAAPAVAPPTINGVPAPQMPTIAPVPAVAQQSQPRAPTGSPGVPASAPSNPQYAGQQTSAPERELVQALQTVTDFQRPASISTTHGTPVTSAAGTVPTAPTSVLNPSLSPGLPPIVPMPVAGTRPASAAPLRHPFPPPAAFQPRQPPVIIDLEAIGDDDSAKTAPAKVVPQNGVGAFPSSAPAPAPAPAPLSAPAISPDSGPPTVNPPVAAPIASRSADTSTNLSVNPVVDTVADKGENPAVADANANGGTKRLAEADVEEHESKRVKLDGSIP